MWWGDGGIPGVRDNQCNDIEAGVFPDSVVREKRVDLVREAVIPHSPGGLIGHNDDLAFTMTEWEATEGY